jgi:hypothetical protein
MQATGSIAVTSRSAGNLDLFAVGEDGVVYTAWWYEGGDWSAVTADWRALGGSFPPGAPISAIAKAPNGIDLFITGNDGRVYTAWWYEGLEWSSINDGNWRAIGGSFPSGAPVTAISKSPTSIDLFSIGNDGRVYTEWWNEGQEWSGLNGWRAIGGFFPAGARVAASSRNSGNLDLFISSNDGRVYTSGWNNGQEWSGINDNWQSVGGVFQPASPVTAVSKSPSSIDLFITGNDGRVYTSWWGEGQQWSGVNDNWRAIGGIFQPAAPVTAISKSLNILDLFIIGNDGRVYTEWWVEGQEWSGINDNWRAIGGFFPQGNPIAVSARTPTNLDLFIVGKGNEVYTSWWAEGYDWSGVGDNWRALAPGA